MIAYLAECDQCRKAFATVRGVSDMADAIHYFGSRHWTVVLAEAGVIRTVCPRCSYKTKEVER